MPKSPAQALGLAWTSFPVKPQTPHSTPKSKSIAEKPAKSLRSHTLNLAAPHAVRPTTR